MPVSRPGLWIYLRNTWKSSLAQDRMNLTEEWVMSSWTFTITRNCVLSISIYKLTTWQDLGINFQAFHVRNQCKHKTEHLLLPFYQVFDTRKQLPFDSDPYCFTENLCKGCNIKCQLHTRYSICNHVKGCLHQSLLLSVVTWPWESSSGASSPLCVWSTFSSLEGILEEVAGPSGTTQPLAHGLHKC